MQLTKCVRLDHFLLVLYSFIAVSTAQSVSTLPDGCYFTSSVVYGNTTGSNTVTTTSQSQSSISTSSAAPTSSFSNGASSFSSTIGPLDTSSTTSPTVPTTTASSPTSSPFLITVSGIGNKLRARTLELLTFEGNYAYLSPNEDLAAVFVLTVDGQLQVGNATVGTNGNRSALPLMQFSGATQPSGYTWSFNATNLIFGNTMFSVIPDGLLFADFPGSQPPEGAVQVGMAAQFVDVSTSSSSLATSTSTSSSSNESTSVLKTTPSTAEQQTSESTQSTPGSSLTTNQVSYSVASTESGPSSDTTTTTTTTIEATSASLQSTEITYTSTSASSLTTQETSTTLASQSSAQISSSIVSSAPESTTSSSQQLSLSVETSSTTVSNDFTSSPSRQTTNAQPSPTTSSLSTTSVATTEGVSPSSPTSALSSLTTTALSSATLSFSTSASASQSPSLSSSATKPTTTLATPTSQSTTKSPSGQGTFSSAFTSSSSTTTNATTTSNTSPTSSQTVSPTISSIVSTTSSSSLTLSSTSSSTPTSTSYPAKRGLVYNNVTTLDFYPPPSPYISWSYNYYSLPNASDDDVGPYPSSQYRFIPLLYNDAESLTSIWSANVNFSVANYGTDAIFGFNEPDANFNGQSSNMPVAESVQGYVNFMQPFAGIVKIGAPAVTNTGGGLTYLAQFLGNATQLNLTIDFLNIHWYASPYNIDYFESYLLQTYNLSLQYFPDAPVPVWVTEFGMDMDNYDQNTTVQFLKNASSFMDDTFWVERYAWFGNFAGGYTSYGAPTTDMLLNVDGSALGVLGEVWYTYNGTN